MEVASVAVGDVVPPAESFNALLSMVEGRLLGLVNAMPAERYNFVPEASIFVSSQSTDFTDVLSFGQTVAHIAEANYGIGRLIAGLDPGLDLTVPGKNAGKDELLAALAASFAYLHRSVDMLAPETAFMSVRGPMTRASQSAFAALHVAMEYGKLVNYVRMCAIVPPATAEAKAKKAALLAGRT